VSEDGGRTWTEKLFMMQPTRVTISTDQPCTTTRSPWSAATPEGATRSAFSIVSARHLGLRPDSLILWNGPGILGLTAWAVEGGSIGPWRSD